MHFLWEDNVFQNGRWYSVKCCCTLSVKINMGHEAPQITSGHGFIFTVEGPFPRVFVICHCYLGKSLIRGYVMREGGRNDLRIIVKVHKTWQTRSLPIGVGHTTYGNMTSEVRKKQMIFWLQWCMASSVRDDEFQYQMRQDCFLQKEARVCVSNAFVIEYRKFKWCFLLWRINKWQRKQIC